MTTLVELRAKYEQLTKAISDRHYLAVDDDPNDSRRHAIEKRMARTTPTTAADAAAQVRMVIEDLEDETVHDLDLPMLQQVVRYLDRLAGSARS